MVREFSFPLLAALLATLPIDVLPELRIGASGLDFLTDESVAGVGMAICADAFDGCRAGVPAGSFGPTGREGPGGLGGSVSGLEGRPETRGFDGKRC